MTQKPVGYHLVEVGKQFKNGVRSKAMEQGISSTYFFIMRHIKEHDNHLTQKDICNCSKMSAPTISVALSNMENEGYIQRVKDNKDNRKLFIELTEKGEELAEQIHSIFNEIETKMKNAIGQEDLEKFHSYLDRISSVL